MRIFAENKETKEVYECNKLMIIANICSEYRCSELVATNMLLDSKIDTPINMSDCEVWIEDKK